MGIATDAPQCVVRPAPPLDLEVAQELEIVMPFLYFPNGGVWLIVGNRPLIAIDWLCGFSVRFRLRTRVERRGKRA